MRECATRAGLWVISTVVGRTLGPAGTLRRSDKSALSSDYTRDMYYLMTTSCYSYTIEILEIRCFVMHTIPATPVLAR